MSNSSSDVLIFIDTETGGTNPSKHSLLSIGCAAWSRHLGVVDSMEVLLKSEKYVITQEARRINKFSKDAHESLALRSGQVIHRLLEFCQRFSFRGVSDLAGHNTQFDVAFIKKLFADNHRSFSRRFSHRTVDTYSILRFLVDSGRIDSSVCSSEQAFKYFGISVDGRHTAMGDAVATAKLYESMLQLLKRG